MSFREKHLWISIAASIGVWGFYFWRVAARIAAGGLAEDGFTGDVSGLFVVCLILVALVEVVLTVIATLTTPKRERDTRDEREILASLRASHVALMALIALVCCVAVVAYFAGLIGGNLVHARAASVTDVNALVLLANILVACLIAAEMIRAGVTLLLLRALR